MARVIQRAVTDRERPLARDLDRADRRAARAALAIRHRARHRRHPPPAQHAQREPPVRRAPALRPARRALQERGDPLVPRARHRLAPADNVTSIFDRDSALDASIASTLARGEPTPEGWEQELRSRFRSRPEVKEALERMWPVLSGAELVNDLFGFRALVRSASGTILTDEEQELLHRRRDPDVAPRAVDRSRPRARRRGRRAARPGRGGAARRPAPQRRRRHLRHRRAGHQRSRSARVRRRGDARRPASASRAGATATANGHEPSFEPRTFGHVLVDEAQDLTAMQWRMLARRCPSGSMTLVGDPGQASKPGAVASWDDVLAHLPTHNATRFVSLSINYRTPAEVMEVASRLLAVAAPTVEPSRSVRSTGEYPRLRLRSPHDDLIATIERAHRAALRTHRRGRGHRAARAARGDRRVARRRRRGVDRGRRARRADRGARPHERQGPRVRPRHRRRTVGSW